MLSTAGFPAHRLSVEVLESSLIEHDQRAVQTLHDLRDLGVQIAVDDFGVGYASVARLHALQPDIVKIDRSLVWAHDASQDHSTLLDDITQLAHQFGAIVIAEGIETSSQHAAATAAGCDAMQGYLLGRPTTTRTTSTPPHQTGSEPPLNRPAPHRVTPSRALRRTRADTPTRLHPEVAHQPESTP